MDYLAEIKPHEDAGKSDAEIADYLLALCRRNLPCGTIVTLCSPTARWSVTWRPKSWAVHSGMRSRPLRIHWPPGSFGTFGWIAVNRSRWTDPKAM